MSDTHAQTVPYVRDTMLPQAEPPLGEKGIVKWTRENLFSSVLNIALTVLSVIFIAYVLMHTLPWFLNGIWSASSLSECREIRNETLGPDASAACFAVLGDRWQQLVFGFYPNDAYWRPVLALIVFLLGLMPVLFDKVPRQALIFTAAAPFLCYMLLWGGSIWGPILVGAGLIAVGFAFTKTTSATNAIVGALVATLVFLCTFADPVSLLLSSFNWVLDWFGGEPKLTLNVFGFDLLSIFPLVGSGTNFLNGLTDEVVGLPFIASKDFGGFTLSLVIGAASIVLSLPLGILLALGRQSPLLIVNKLSVAFIEIIRGVPLIVWLFTASLLLNYFLPKGTSFDLTLRVIIMVTLFSAAYIAEVVRGGLAALPKGQYEAADALGLDYWQAMRLIILPQALKISIPGIVNTFIGLFKDTTLVVFIGLFDPLGLTNAIRASTDWNGIYWELYVFIGVMFFIFCFSMGRYSLYLEKKLQRENR
ncbi:amino acid ABC transporter permease [Loktanella agnita]|uniref:amino acid ABC transporter permease n=1 Tax=Loktanella agnita TaxID=287097 RepID=UPI003985F3D9